MKPAERVERVPPSGIRRFFELAEQMDDVISLGVGEPDFDTPWNIRNATIQSLENGFTNYTSNQGLQELRDTLSEYLNEKYDLNYDPGDELLVTTGVSEGMDLAMRALINPGDGVLIPDPCYISYVPTARMAGGTVNRIPTTPENNFKIQPDQLREILDEDDKILCLNYPANPTGSTYGRDRLEAIAKIVNEHDLLVISDEIYGDLTFEKDHVPIAGLEDLRDRTLLLNGFSKAYAMTGFRVGYAAGPSDLIATMNKIHQYTMLCAPTPAQFGAIEALLNGERPMKNMREEYRKRRDLVVHRFRRMGFDCVEPEGSFYAFPSVESTGLDSRTFCEDLLEEKKVAAVPGPAFGSAGEGHIRVSFATDREQLTEALNRIESFVEDLAETPTSSEPATGT
jgi:aminotransferase